LPALGSVISRSCATGPDTKSPTKNPASAAGLQPFAGGCSSSNQIFFPWPLCKALSYGQPHRITGIHLTRKAATKRHLHRTSVGDILMPVAMRFSTFPLAPPPSKRARAAAAELYPLLTDHFSLATFARACNKAIERNQANGKLLRLSEKLDQLPTRAYEEMDAAAFDTPRSGSPIPRAFQKAWPSSISELAPKIVNKHPASFKQIETKTIRRRAFQMVLENEDPEMKQDGPHDRRQTVCSSEGELSNRELKLLFAAKRPPTTTKTSIVEIRGRHWWRRSALFRGRTFSVCNSRLRGNAELGKLEILESSPSFLWGRPQGKLWSPFAGKQSVLHS